MSISRRLIERLIGEEIDIRGGIVGISEEDLKTLARDIFNLSSSAIMTDGAKGLIKDKIDQAYNNRRQEDN